MTSSDTTGYSASNEATFSLTPEELNLILLWRRLNKRQRVALWEFLEVLAGE